MDNDFRNDTLLQVATLEQRRKERRLKKKKEELKNANFMNQKVDLVNSILFPDGYENIMIAVYFILIPYINGLLFLFLYVANGNYTAFFSFNKENSFMLTWVIGYELTAALILLWITKLGITSMLNSSNKKVKKQFRRP